ncbi:MAG: glycosyltransferase family 39 protein [Bacteroidota bacterium]
MPIVQQPNWMPGIGNCSIDALDEALYGLERVSDELMSFIYLPAVLRSVSFQFYLAIAVLLLGSWFSIGFHQSDEHYQILEFAAMRAGHSPVGDLPWEYAEQMRPGLQPFMAYVVYRIIGDPFWTTFFLRLLSGAFTLWVAWLVFSRCLPQLGQKDWRPWLAGACLLHWAMWYSGLRFSSESWSGLMFALGYLTYMSLSGKSSEPARQAHKYLFLSGFCFGLAFCFRYQVGLLVLGFGAWLLFVQREKWLRLGSIVFGGLFALTLGVLTDYWLYGQWVNAPWNYLAQNLIEGKAATFGTRPWWGYFELVFLRGIPPLSLLYVLAPLVFFWHHRKHPLTWSWVPFLLIHIVLSRKDVRFLFPLLPLLPIVLLGAWQVVVVYSEGHVRFKQSSSFTLGSRWRYLAYLIVLMNLGILAVNAFRPMRPSIAAAEYVYRHLPEDTILVVPEGRPYVFYDLPAHFYRREGLQLVSECPSGVDCYHILKAKPKEVPSDVRVLWTNRPSWLPVVGADWYWVVK